MPELIAALGWTDKQPDLADVVLPSLNDAVSAFIGALVASLDNMPCEETRSDESPKWWEPFEREKALKRYAPCDTLAGMMMTPRATNLCKERHPQSIDALARTIKGTQMSLKFRRMRSGPCCKLLASSAPCRSCAPVFTATFRSWRYFTTSRTFLRRSVGMWSAGFWRSRCDTWVTQRSQRQRQGFSRDVPS